ncbi:hypothetical protein Trydic_g18683, partial [Trypoxylus dichotomus]
VFLDIEKAFDRVWHAGLIHKMVEAKLPNPIISVVKSYLTDRSFHVAVEDTTSTTRKIRVGVPQGSVLGPHLFNIYMADIPTPQHSQIAQFADDTAIYFSSRNKKHLTKRMQEDIDTLTDYFRTWRIRINPTKSLAVHFRNHRRFNLPEPVTIEGHEIPWKKEAKYLGVTLDERLTYRTHANELSRRIGQAAGALYPLLNGRSKLDIKNTTRIIKTIIIPTATYAGEVWHQFDSHGKRTVQSRINGIVRRAVQASKYLPTNRLFQELHLEFLEDIAARRAHGTYEKMTTHTNPALRAAIRTRGENARFQGLRGLKRKTDDNPDLLRKKKKWT